MPSVTPDREPEEPLWSPPQFGIRTMLIAMVLLAALMAVIHYTGPGGAMCVLVFSFVCWLAVCFVRLVRLSDDGRDQ
jgi:hypothetical protein